MALNALDLNKCEPAVHLFEAVLFRKSKELSHGEDISRLVSFTVFVL